ncbi:MAG: glutamine--tRNA ligase/YqeY domain fusion protein [Eubacteriaceae bacterium]|jgi:glutaminyl-tRNA synthetase
MEANEKKNFIINAIDADIESGKYKPEEIITRFPPEPNGYLHIGHIKAALLNYGIAQRYGGKFNLRFDDTNPAKEETEYIDSIQEDLKWLGLDWGDHYKSGSSYFPKMIEFAKELIGKGLAYVDDQSFEEIRAGRGTLTESGTESPFRNRSVEENMDLFDRMISGEFDEGSRVLRAKVDMNSPNMNMRDPVIYRILKAEHHSTDETWNVYPMYDFAHPIEDAIEGVTHSLCTLEFEDHRPIYDWVLANLDEFKEKPPVQIEFAKLGLTDTIMGKRYLKKLVDEGIVDGWDDPRLSTVSGLRRRGYTPEALRAFCDEIGVAKANSTVDRQMLEHFIRNDLKLKTSRLNVVMDPLKVTITNWPEDQIEWLETETNFDVPEMGMHKEPFGRHLYVERDDFMEVPAKKYFRLYPGNEVRLRGAYFIKCNEVIKDENGKVTELLCTYDPETKAGTGFTGRKVKGTIHWVEAGHAVQVPVNLYNPLISDDEFSPDDFTEKIHDDSLIRTTGFAEPRILETEPGEKVQFVRIGYFNADPKYSKPGAPVFNRIVELKSSWRPPKN